MEQFMSLLPHSIHWVKGEILEAQLMLVFSGLALVSALLFWKFGTTPAAKAIVLPIFVVGVIISISGLTMTFSNQQRLGIYPAEYQKGLSTFLVKEKERVEGFIPVYNQTKIGVTALLIIAILLLWLTSSVTFHGIALGMILMACTAISIDYFSNERAKQYLQQINNQLPVPASITNSTIINSKD